MNTVINCVHETDSCPVPTVTYYVLNGTLKSTRLLY